MAVVIILVFFLLNVEGARDVQMNGNVIGILGSDSTRLECLFTIDIRDTLSTVVFYGRNLTTENFDEIVYLKPEREPYIDSFGKYLFQNVTLIFSNLSMSSTKAEITITDLQCKHGRQYKCEVWADPIHGRPGSTISESITVSVEVPPSRPNNVFFKIKPNETVNESLLIETTFIVNDNTTVPSTSEAMQNGDFIFANITLAEGNIVTFFCSGVVGNPPRTFLWQKIDPLGHLTFDKNASTSFQKIDGECYYNGSSEVTYTVTAEDNQAKIYCLVENMTELNSTTGPLEVYYKVRKPTITKHPNQHMYGQETETLTLNCTADGNPPPSILWKKNDKILGHMSHYEITDLTTNKSGIYECVAYNSFQNKEYMDFTSVNITVVDEIVTTTPAPTEKPTQSSSETVTSRVEKSQESIIYIIVAVVVVVAVVVIAVGIGYMLWKRKEIPKNAKGSMRMTEDQYENKSFSDEANKTEKAVESNTPDTTVDNNSSHKTVL